MKKDWMNRDWMDDMKYDTPMAWRSQLVWGIMIIAAGVLFLLDRTGEMDIASLWRYWPALLVIAGLSNLVPPTTPKLILSGLSSIGFAVWFYVSFEHLWGLSFHSSWPILVIMWGVKVVLKPLLYQQFASKE